MVDAGFLSIIPPIVAIVLALVTKEVIFCTKKRLRTNYLVRQPHLSPYFIPIFNFFPNYITVGDAITP